MFRQIRRTLRTFSIQYFRTDVCPKIANQESRKNDFQRVTTFIPTNYNSPNDGKFFTIYEPFYSRIYRVLQEI